MKKRALFIVGALLLCATIVVGTTLAYLAAESNTKTNTFTFDAQGSKIEIELQEPSWNDANGVNFIPGKNIPKDPQIELKNGVKSYVAMILKADDTKDIKTIAGIREITEFDGLSTAWTVKYSTDGKTMYAFYTGGTLQKPSNAVSPKVFTGVKIRNKYAADHVDTAKQNQPIPQDAYGSFDLVIQGYAVQAENDEATTWDCETAIKEAFPTAFADCPA